MARRPAASLQLCSGDLAEGLNAHDRCTPYLIFVYVWQAVMGNDVAQPVQRPPGLGMQRIESFRVDVGEGLVADRNP